LGASAGHGGQSTGLGKEREPAQTLPPFSQGQKQGHEVNTLGVAMTPIRLQSSGIHPLPHTRPDLGARPGEEMHT
jgi:hypothetical protein